MFGLTCAFIALLIVCSRKADKATQESARSGLSSVRWAAVPIPAIPPFEWVSWLLIGLTCIFIAVLDLCSRKADKRWVSSEQT